ncbi:MAG: hypothetical protein ACE5PM_04585 [Candidatus Hydrothermarchaeales archaeon]
MDDAALVNNVSTMRCYCRAMLEWVEEGRRFRCPKEGVVYEIPKRVNTSL